MPVNPFDVQGIEHMFGINYHARSDTVVAIYSSGNLIAFDRRSGRTGGPRPPELAARGMSLQRLGGGPTQVGGACWAGHCRFGVNRPSSVSKNPNLATLQHELRSR